MQLVNLRLNIDKIVVTLLFFSYAMQYNPFFSAEYLWKDYWTGSATRTGISLTSLVMALLLVCFRHNKLKVGPTFIIATLVSAGIYGIAIGGISNTNAQFIVSDSIIWFETAAYLFIFGVLPYSITTKLLRSIIIYSIFAGLLSIGVFWYIRDEIAVAALIGGARVVRLADFQAPLMLILLHFKPLNFPRKMIRFGSLIFLTIIFLGFFRSVWAALLLAILFRYLTTPKMLLQKKVVTQILIGVLTVIIFERLYSVLTGVDAALTGRIMAAVGSTDSLGRISSTIAVLEQFTQNTVGLLFGNGFGAMAWFVNDFGDGAIGALQPVGSLSNYHVAMLFQFGLFGHSVILCLVFLAFIKYWRTSTFEVRQMLITLSVYVAMQWLTFPSMIHFPTAMTLALAISFLGSRKQDINDTLLQTKRTL